MPDNTSGNQDAEIRKAEGSHIENLIAIINDLDSQITAWKTASEGCKDPGDLEAKLSDLNLKLNAAEDALANT